MGFVFDFTRQCFTSDVSRTFYTMGCISVKHNREGKSMSDLNDDDPFRNCDTVDSYVEVIHNSIIAGK